LRWTKRLLLSTSKAQQLVVSISLRGSLKIYFFVLVLPGRGGNLMKVGAKRRRGKAQIKEEARAEKHKEAEIAKKLAEIESMQQQIQELQPKAQQV